MISFRWPYLPVGLICFLVGLLIGLLWRLPFDQASTLAGLIVGLLVGVIGVAATLWVAAHDRGLKLGDIQRDVADVKGSVGSLQAVASQMWTPVLTALAAAQFGTSTQPKVYSSVQQERTEPAPSKPETSELSVGTTTGGTS